MFVPDQSQFLTGMPPANAAIPTSARIRAFLPYVAPGVVTTGAFAAARWWSATGGAGSVGTAVLLGGMAAAAGLAGWRGTAGTAGSSAAFAGAGALAVSAVATYSTGWAGPVLMWILTTAAAYTIAAHGWREAREAARRAGERLEEVRTEAAARVQVEAIRTSGMVEAVRVLGEAENARVDKIIAASQQRLSALEAGGDAGSLLPQGGDALRLMAGEALYAVPAADVG